MKDQISEMESDMVLYENYIHKDAGRAYLEAAKEAWNAYVSVTDSVVAMSREGNNADAQALLEGQGQTAFGELGSRMNALVQYNVEESQKSAAKINSTYIFSIVFMVAFAAAAIIVGGMILQPLFDKLKALLRVNTEAASWTLFGRLRTVFLFMIVCSVQPAESLINALKMWKNAFVFNPWVLVDGSLFQLGLDRIDFWVMVFGLLLLFVVSKYQQRGSVRETIAKQNLAFRWLLWLGLFVAVLLFGMYGEGYNPADFIYGGF